MKIPSFNIDHNSLLKGVYISRVDGDIFTYDLRFRRPYADPVLTGVEIHSVESPVLRSVHHRVHAHREYADDAQNEDYIENLRYVAVSSPEIHLKIPSVKIVFALPFANY